MCEIIKSKIVCLKVYLADVKSVHIYYSKYNILACIPIVAK